MFISSAEINAQGNGAIYMSYNGVNTSFNDDVLVNCSGTGGVRFGASQGTATIASGKTIKPGSLGFQMVYCK
ncbi:MAG: hypothetical protein IPK10_01760 [Bacteroidetes bacterium]|nr:hypothetical protein [Bacteroidota bacterium]